jgi:exodeoxyribonuclease X
MITVIDTETTGIDCKVDRLVELAACPVGPTTHSNFTTFVNPERDIPPEAKAIHHITEADVAGAPKEGAALVEMLEHYKFEPSVFVAHNAKFDRGFIERINPALNVQWVCTYKCAVLAWPDAPSHSNQVLRYYLDLDLSGQLPEGLFPHRALYDTIVTRGILERLLQRVSLDRLIEISSGPILLSKVSFGKHKGMAWADVPHGYLKWCASQTDMNEDVLHTARHYLRRT